MLPRSTALKRLADNHVRQIQQLQDNLSAVIQGNNEMAGKIKDQSDVERYVGGIQSECEEKVRAEQTMEINSLNWRPQPQPG